MVPLPQHTHVQATTLKSATKGTQENLGAPLLKHLVNDRNDRTGSTGSWTPRSSDLPNPSWCLWAGDGSSAVCREAGSYSNQQNIITEIRLDVSVGRAVVEMKRYIQLNKHCTWIQFRRRQPKYLLKCCLLERTQT